MMASGQQLLGTLDCFAGPRNDGIMETLELELEVTNMGKKHRMFLAKIITILLFLHLATELIQRNSLAA
ncbi:MAG: hypothetical protein LBV04_08625 [Deferribacteraceae bacterium]|jgi:hypothetical protein|nr:hypothetical protein [Deferribacteraceae bacterium]